MESIDALAQAVNEYKGGLVLVSHDMRLISQVANEILICDNKTIEKYKGDVLNFKMDMRDQMGIAGEQKGNLKGDASVKKKPGDAKPKPPPKKPEPILEVVAPLVSKPKEASLRSISISASGGWKEAIHPAAHAQKDAAGATARVIQNASPQTKFLGSKFVGLYFKLY